MFHGSKVFPMLALVSIFTNHLRTTNKTSLFRYLPHILILITPANISRLKTPGKTKQLTDVAGVNLRRCKTTHNQTP